MGTALVKRRRRGDKCTTDGCYRKRRQRFSLEAQPSLPHPTLDRRVGNRKGEPIGATSLSSMEFSPASNPRMHGPPPEVVVTACGSECKGTEELAPCCIGLQETNEEVIEMTTARPSGDTGRAVAVEMGANGVVQEMNANVAECNEDNCDRSNGRGDESQMLCEEHGGVEIIGVDGVNPPSQMPRSPGESHRGIVDAGNQRSGRSACGSDGAGVGRTVVSLSATNSNNRDSSRVKNSSVSRGNSRQGSRQRRNYGISVFENTRLARTTPSTSPSTTGHYFSARIGDNSRRPAQGHSITSRSHSNMRDIGSLRAENAASKYKEQRRRELYAWNKELRLKSAGASDSDAV
ncbi:hypothetical protein TRVL_01956 [Trypanosoma vivax]|nr:hypothetical protein TRVL_01956 [Trypanosoma vivax]